MRVVFRVIFIGLLLVTLGVFFWCGDVIVSDLDPTKFVEPTVTPTLSVGG